MNAVFIVVEQNCEDLDIVGVFAEEHVAADFVAENPYVPFQKGRWIEEWAVQA